MALWKKNASYTKDQQVEYPAGIFWSVTQSVKKSSTPPAAGSAYFRLIPPLAPNPDAQVIADLRGQLAALDAKLLAVARQLVTTQQQHGDSLAELTATKAQLSAAKSDLRAAQVEIEALKQRLQAPPTTPVPPVPPIPAPPAPTGITYDPVRRLTLAPLNPADFETAFVKP